jgi:hypothetical protein
MMALEGLLSSSACKSWRRSQALQSCRVCLVQGAPEPHDLTLVGDAGSGQVALQAPGGTKE